MTGGASYKGGSTYLDSTEVLEAGGTWRLTAPLASARRALKAGVLNNNIFVFGENILCYINIEHLIVSYNLYNDHIFTGESIGPNARSDILQYDTTNQTWEEVGQMKQARGHHAIATLGDVSVFCP